MENLDTCIFCIFIFICLLGLFCQKINLEIKKHKNDPIISKYTGFDRKFRILCRILFGKDEQ